MSLQASIEAALVRVAAETKAARRGYVAVNAQTGITYTLAASDAGKLVTCTNAGPITVTVPASVLTVGQRVDVAVLGAGMVTFTGSGGMTLTGTPSLVTRATGSAVTIVALSATTGLVVGDLA